MKKTVSQTLALATFSLFLTTLLALVFLPGSANARSTAYTCYDSKYPNCAGTCPKMTPKCEGNMVSKTCVCN